MFSKNNIKPPMLYFLFPIVPSTVLRYIHIEIDDIILIGMFFFTIQQYSR